jgi:hypothetical protein
MRALKVCLLSLSAWLVGCETSLLDDPSFDRWCGEQLCDWDVEVGQIERVGSWHKRDYAVSFLEAPTRISQLSRLFVANSCLRFDLIADVDASARMVLRVDYNDDGIAEEEQYVNEADWQTTSFVIHTPRSFGKVRFSFEKQGEGRAVLAQMWVDTDSSCLP